MAAVVESSDVFPAQAGEEPGKRGDPAKKRIKKLSISTVVTVVVNVPRSFALVADGTIVRRPPDCWVTSLLGK